MPNVIALANEKKINNSQRNNNSNSKNDSNYEAYSSKNTDRKIEKNSVLILKIMKIMN